MATFTPPVQTTGPDAPVTTTDPTTVAAPPSEAPAPSEIPSPSPDAPLIAGKFKTQDDLVAAYKALEAKLGTKPLDQQIAEAQQQPQDQQPKSTGGLDLTSYQAEYGRDGKLSDASYEGLAKAGITKDVVDAYIRGQEAIFQQSVAEATASVGGPEGYQKLTEWAGKNLSAPEIDAYNRAVSSGDQGLMKMAIGALHAKYQAAEGSPPNLVSGQPGRGGGGYESVEQMKADMKDPRYIAGDKAFHNMVDRKIRATTAF